MKTKRSKFAAVVIVLALLASVTLLAGCVAIPTTTPTNEPTSLSTIHRRRRPLRRQFHRPQLRGPPQIHNLCRLTSRIA